MSGTHADIDAVTQAYLTACDDFSQFIQKDERLPVGRALMIDGYWGTDIAAIEFRNALELAQEKLTAISAGQDYARAYRIEKLRRLIAKALRDLESHPEMRTLFRWGPQKPQRGLASESPSPRTKEKRNGR